YTCFVKFRENACVLLKAGFEWGAFFWFRLWVWGLDGSIFGFGNYFSISQLENADPNAEMIVRELEMFSTILKKVASDNTKNLTVATNSYEKYC
ncbi:hypothetical protein, partial [bacterium endosymbiont of Bathymodiolus sp. 5 South]|uniref:hypothetical protein n=1 Tax=bacterium endosymbiont of Bathymodiolus sp. 5 South TaxID=1181670 RepID=UPI0015D64FAB